MHDFGEHIHCCIWFGRQTFWINADAAQEPGTIQCVKFLLTTTPCNTARCLHSDNEVCKPTCPTRMHCETVNSKAWYFTQIAFRFLNRSTVAMPSFRLLIHILHKLMYAYNEFKHQTRFFPLWAYIVLYRNWKLLIFDLLIWEQPYLLKPFKRSSTVELLQSRSNFFQAIFNARNYIIEVYTSGPILIVLSYSKPPRRRVSLRRDDCAIPRGITKLFRPIHPPTDITFCHGCEE